jgi:hypothetical protein
MAPSMVAQYAKAISERYAAIDAAQAAHQAAAAAAARAADLAPVKRRLFAAAMRAAKSMDGRTSVPGEPSAPTTKGKIRKKADEPQRETLSARDVLR